MASLYGVLQYFGIDPFVAPNAYNVGEGEWTIVRTPGTMGHAGYFATYLVAVIFWAAALGRRENSQAMAGPRLHHVRGWIFRRRAQWNSRRDSWTACRRNRHHHLARAAPESASDPGNDACGHRACRILFFTARRKAARAHALVRRGRRRRRTLVTLARFAAACSPRGLGSPAPDLKLSERNFRDFFRKSSRSAYPNRYYESPHNIFVDALTSQGMLRGFRSSQRWPALRCLRSRRLRNSNFAAGECFAAAFMASLCSNQFLAFTAPTALYFHFSVVLLVVVSLPVLQSAHSSRWIWAVSAPAAALVVLFSGATHRGGLAASDSPKRCRVGKDCESD